MVIQSEETSGKTQNTERYTHSRTIWESLVFSQVQMFVCNQVDWRSHLSWSSHGRQQEAWEEGRPSGSFCFHLLVLDQKKSREGLGHITTRATRSGWVVWTPELSGSALWKHTASEMPTLPSVGLTCRMERNPGSLSPCTGIRVIKREEREDAGQNVKEEDKGAVS